MKFLMVFLLALVLCITYAESKDTECKAKGGMCISRELARGRCDLPFECGSSAVCCNIRRQMNERDSMSIEGGNDGGIKAGIKSVKRKCRKTRKKCSKEGGTCVPTNGNDCDTSAVDNLCKGASCTCCLGDKKSCDSLPGCKFRGGFCINKKKTSFCYAGTMKNKLCAGKKCSCCLVERNCQCGQANDVRIVGGEEVSPNNKYPWVVGIRSPKSSDIYTCGGSIINDLYIITAAHCLFDAFTLEAIPVEDILVTVADHNQNSTDDDVPGVTMELEIEDYIVHENYNPLELDEDIALIKLKEPLNLSANKELKPVCLPIDEEETYEGADAIAAGWGFLDYEVFSPSDTLMEVGVPILAPECEGDFPDFVTITENMICAGFTEGERDSCNGDSGGPLVVKEGSSHILAGIVSFGFGCGEPNSPGVYTRVTRYLDWIIDNTSDANYCS